MVDSILVTATTFTMRITFVVNLPAFLLALAVGAVAVPSSINPVEKDPLVQGPSHFSFSLSLRLPFFAQLVDSRG
jgi:hypothetical protein